MEILGHHDFRKDGTILKADRIKYWLSVGAKATDTAHNLLLKNKIITGKKINVLPKKTFTKKEEPVVEAPKAAAPAEAPAPVEETPAPVEAAPAVEATPEVTA